MKELFKNFEGFSTILMATSILSNSQCDELKKDSDAIIDFMGAAFGYDEKLIESCRQAVEELANVGLISDRLAIYSGRNSVDSFSDNDLFMDVKCGVLSQLEALSKCNDPYINSDWFDFSHYIPYCAEMRYIMIKVSGASGNIITTRQCAIMEALGIGCEKNLQKAAKRFMQCVMWGDLPSTFLLAHVYALLNDEKSKTFAEVSVICQEYLYRGITVLPEEAIKLYSEDARIYYSYIASIMQDIVYPYQRKNIDFSFVEAIMSDTLDYYKRMKFINNYEKKEWKEVTNSSQRPKGKLGF